jgi:hypothetical protein
VAGGINELGGIIINGENPNGIGKFPSIPIFGGGIMLNNDWFIDKLSMVG